MSDALRKDLTEVTGSLTASIMAESEAKVAHLYNKEELRAAEGHATVERIATGMLGKNDVERRAQLDQDCSAERTKMIDSEAECIRATALREANAAAHQTLITLLK